MLLEKSKNKLPKFTRPREPFYYNVETHTCFRVEAITEKRIKRWALSMEDLVSDATGKWLLLLLLL